MGLQIEGALFARSKSALTDVNLGAVFRAGELQVATSGAVGFVVSFVFFGGEEKADRASTRDFFIAQNGLDIGVFQNRF